MDSSFANPSAVAAHYDRAQDLDAIAVAALTSMGKDVAALTVDDLAPLDQFHTGGIAATRAIAELGGIAAGERVIDIGGGLGGPARVIAHEYGATVTVVDLAESFVVGGAALSARLGLTDRVAFHLGDALALPFPDGSFDVAWTQHATMNIEDKAGLYREVRRVLRPGGRLVMHEIMAGPGGPLHFPVPWASDPSISFLKSPDEIRNLLTTDLGFTERAWRDTTDEARDWFATMSARSAAAGPPPLGLHLVMGADFSDRISSLARNLSEDRVRVIQAVFDAVE